MAEENQKSNAGSNAADAAMILNKIKNAKAGTKKGMAAIKVLTSPVFWIGLGIFLLIVIVTNFIQIIFSYLGYNSAADYVKDSAKIEATNLTEGVADLFSNVTYRNGVDKTFFTYDGTLFSITGMELPSKGIGAKEYATIEQDYVGTVNANTDIYTIYDGYTVDNQYNGFWANDYISYLLPIIQERLNTNQIKNIQKQSKSGYEACVKKLIASLDKYKWFYVEELPDTVTYEDVYEMTGDPGAAIEEGKKPIRYTHIIKNYKIGMEQAQKLQMNYENYSYRKVTDPQVFDMVQSMLSDLESGKHGQALFHVSSGLVKTLWNKIKSLFQKDYSWREITVRTGYGNGSGGTIEDGSYTPIGDITIPAGAEADTFLLATLVKAEAGNQPYEGQIAVAYVVLNRMSQWKLDMQGVIYQEGQFACIDDKNFNKAMVALSALSAEQLMADSSYNAAAAAISGVGGNPIGTMCFFMNPSNASQARILAHNTESEYKIIGDHWFFTNW